MLISKAIKAKSRNKKVENTRKDRASTFKQVAHKQIKEEKCFQREIF